MGYKRKLRKIRSSLSCIFGKRKKKLQHEADQCYDNDKDDHRPPSPVLSFVKDEELDQYIEDEVDHMDDEVDQLVASQSRASMFAYNGRQIGTPRRKSSHEHIPIPSPPLLSPSTSSYSLVSNMTQSHSIKVKPSTEEMSRHIRTASMDRLSVSHLNQDELFQFGSYNKLLSPASDAITLEEDDLLKTPSHGNTSLSGFALPSPLSLFFKPDNSYSNTDLKVSHTNGIPKEIVSSGVQPSSTNMSSSFHVASAISSIEAPSDEKMLLHAKSGTIKLPPSRSSKDSQLSGISLMEDNKRLGSKFSQEMSEQSKLPLSRPFLEAPSDEKSLRPKASENEENEGVAKISASQFVDGESTKLPTTELAKKKKFIQSLRSRYTSSSSSVQSKEGPLKPQDVNIVKKPSFQNSLVKNLSKQGDDVDHVTNEELSSQTSGITNISQVSVVVTPIRPNSSQFKVRDSLPSLESESQDEVPKKKIKIEEKENQVQKKLVRYDGWHNFRDMAAFGAGDFYIMGTNGRDPSTEPRVLSPPLMESLQMFLPFVCSEDHFWLKFSMIRDGAGFETLLSKIKGSTRTVIAVETTKGEVFGSFTSEAWKIQPKYFGTGESFLWRIKGSRLIEEHEENSRLDSDIEVYPFTGLDTCVQKCTHDQLIVGGGPWNDKDCPFETEPKSSGLVIHENLQKGSSGTCATFANRALSKLDFQGTFEISNLEVWTLTPFYPESQAKIAEDRKIFIDENLNSPIARRQ